MSLDLASARRTDHLSLSHQDGHGPALSEPGSTLSPPFSTSTSASSLVSSSSSAYPASLSSSSALSPSSSSNSVSSADASFPPPPPPRDLSRRSSGRPLPLALQTISQSNANANANTATAATSNKPLALRFSPRTSSLSTLPSIATITTTVAGSSERRSQSLSQSLASAVPSPPASVLHSPPSSPPIPIRRKPLASAIVSPLAIVNRAAQPEQHGQSKQPEQPEQEEQEHPFSLDSELRSELGSEFDLGFDIDDFLPTPDQRFTRSGSVDSPTLYEFPKSGTLFNVPNALAPSSLSRASSHSPSLSVSKPADKESSAVFPDAEGPETRDAAARALLSRNSSASTPAAPQTRPTTASSQHEQELTTTNLGSDQILAAQPFNYSSNSSERSEGEDEPDQEVEASHITHRDSTMSLFTRKASPPHLSLGSISNNNTTNNHSNLNNKDDNAQRSVSPDQNSIYSVYEDEDEIEEKDYEILTAVPIISTSTSTTTKNDSAPTAVASIITTQVDSANTLKPIDKSPSSFKLGNFFGWPSPSSASTEFSDQGFSPLPSPSSLQPPNTAITHASTLSTPGTNSPSYQDSYNKNSNSNNSKNTNLLSILSPTKTNTSGDESLGYYEDYLQTPPIITTTARTASPSSPHSLSQQHGQIEEMEDELKAISAELAASIRREMDLEDLVDRLQTEVNNPQPPGKRTSDYFSDSGHLSNKFSDYDAAKEEIAQVQRRAEQEKAQIRLELTDKLTDERSRRRVLDQQIKELSDRAANLDLDAMQRGSGDTGARVKQLESTCDDLRRRLSEERGVKENFEDLLTAMKTELQNASNERDNLRDEVVPQLRARVEGLESQATEHARQIYETTKMQQELHSLKTENSGLRTAAASVATLSADGEQQQDKGFRVPQQPTGLSRSNTVKGQGSSTTTESREALADRLKDVEAQRDALHSALKSLLERQEFQNRENDKKIRVLEMERQRLLTASPKKAGYERDVAGLRDEVAVLRRRAEEALEQKWQVEKGLGGLKMDLDRAEEEIAHLRMTLQQRDILLPSDGSSRSASNTSSVYDTDGTGATSVSSSTPVTSASLESAYKGLQRSYADALERIRALESSSGALGSVIPTDEKTTLALERLERSLSSTVAERDAARQQVATQSTRLADTAGAEKALLESEKSLAAQLDASARRVEELAQQVRTQLETNAKLRERLTQMVARGEADQQTHKVRITGLESRLRSLEDQLVATQTAAEERVARHEEQVAALREAHNTQLQRLRDASGALRAVSPSRAGGGASSPRLLSSSQFGNGSRSPMMPASPMFSVNGKLVPPATPSSRPSSRGSIMSGGGASTSAAAAAAAEQEQQAQVATLRARVSELEAALTNADREMQEVVGRMNTAQIEVMQLQEELEVAGRETRRLQRQIETEQVKSFEERFRILSRSATAA